jgi:probable F420-dependent oxidoreductase
MSRPFRFGLVAAYAPTREVWVRTARRAEELGYATLLIPDRTTVGLPAAIPALTVAASVTTSLRVGSYVFANGYRHPLLLAREAATLDLLSDGRFELGLGAGVSGEEYASMGLPFASPGTRVEQLAEALQVIKLALTEEKVNFQGKHYTLTNVEGNIKPVQKPHLPIMVAGSGERMLRLAAREADSIALGSRRGADPHEATLEQKIAWIKDAAGPRFADLELGQAIYDLEITDSPVPASSQGAWMVTTKRQMTIEQAVAHLLEQREHYGLSYLHLSMGQLENFAPVLAQLVDK